MTRSPTDSSRPLIQLCNVSKSFPGVKALAEVSLDLYPGTVHALLGENGAGKSTLINILSGVLQPDAGEFCVHGRPVKPADARAARALGIATVYQEADLFPDLTVAENVALEHAWPRRSGLIDWSALRRTTRQALHTLGCSLDPDRPASTLTAAERQLVGIAAALAQAGSVLILDEPTSSLSRAETQTLFEHLRRYRSAGGVILYVSHRLEEVFQLADVVTVLRDGRRIWSGPLTETTPERLIALMVGREMVMTSGVPASQRANRADAPVRLACQGLTAADGSFQDVSLEARAGEVLGLYGLIGAGRSEWAQTVFGLRAVSAGTVIVDGKAGLLHSPGEAARHGLAYLPEDRLRLGLCAGLSVRANAVLAALRRLSVGPFVTVRKETRRTRALVEQLSVRLRSLLQPAGTLSGGNQQKVILGRWLACEPTTLILDEPTRGVDVGAKAEIHELLRRLADSGRAVILISSDLPEILAHSDRVGIFRRGRLVEMLETRHATAEQVAAAALPIGPDGVGRSREPSGTGGGAGAPRLGAPTSKTAWLREAGLLAVVILLAAVLAWRTDTFWQPGTLRDVGENAALLTLCGLASALVILTGAIDISFGSMMALGAAVSACLMRLGISTPVAVLAGLATATAAGGLNAILTLLGRVHPIVVTLGTMSVYRGLTQLLIASQAIHEVPAGFRAPWQAAPLGVPAAVWMALAAVALTWFLLGWTGPGRQVIALGSNAAAARRTGIHPARVWLAVFSLQGLIAGVAGLLALALAGHLQSTDFEEKTLEAIGVAVVGGIAITGGRGSVWGICAAALLFRVLEKGWVLLNISGYWQRTIVGSLLLLAILGDQLWRHRTATPPSAA
jgi:ABC-type sugar transport system ATPase subunit/ribose/xylose/arabinose/galactoside ABC-type transport system permease subunit